MTIKLIHQPTILQYLVSIKNKPKLIFIRGCQLIITDTFSIVGDFDMFHVYTYSHSLYELRDEFTKILKGNLKKWK